MWTKRPSSLFRARRAPASVHEAPEPAGGTVTAVELQKRTRSDRVNVCIDGKFAFSLAADTGFRLKIGECIEADGIRVLLDADASERAYQRALRFLAARPRSVLEVRRRLRASGIGEQPTSQVIDRLQDHGLLDDAQFASYWVEQRQAFRPRGPRALRSELSAKGVAREAMAPAIAAAADDQCEAACRAGLREARRRASEGEREFARTVGAYLARRGFDFGATRAAVRQLWRLVLDERGA